MAVQSSQDASASTSREDRNYRLGNILANHSLFHSRVDHLASSSKVSMSPPIIKVPPFSRVLLDVRVRLVYSFRHREATKIDDVEVEKRGRKQ